MEHLSARIWLQLLRKQPRLTATTSILLPVAAPCYIVSTSAGRDPSKVCPTDSLVRISREMDDVSAGNCAKAGGAKRRRRRRKRREKTGRGWSGKVYYRRRPGSSSPRLALEILHGVSSSIKGHVIFRGRDGESRAERNFEP